MTKLATLTAAVFLTLSASALASPVKSYVLHHPKHENCRVHYVRKVEKVRLGKHHRGRRVRETVCVYVAPKPAVVKAPAAPAIIAPSITAPPSAAAPKPSFTLHAKLDPSFTQNAGNPLAVTYDYSASANKLTDGVSQGEPSLPSGVLELYSEGLLACSMDVGGATGEGQCPVTYGSYGTHTVIVEYLSGEASGTTGDEAERIEPPDVTVQKVWTAGAASMTITKDTASVKLSAPSFDGATSVGLTDNLGDTCVAAVSGTQATCSMTVSGEPSGLTVSYPGGTTTRHTEAFAPGGEREVTEEWAPQTVPVTPSVTAYRATVAWSSWTIGNSGSSKDHGTGNPPDPIHVEAGELLTLDSQAIGDYPGDDENSPLGYLAYTVEGPGAVTTRNELYNPGSEETFITGSEDCSAARNYLGSATAFCGLTFSVPGTYIVRLSFTSEDENYFDRSGPSATVDVG